MSPSIASVVFSALAALTAFQANFANAGAQPPQAASPAKSQKLPRAQPLDRGAVFERDPVSGELHASVEGTGEGSAGAGNIRSRGTPVQVAGTVTAPDGTQV